MTFSPAELRLLAASDRAIGSRNRSATRRCKYGGLGSLTYDAAMMMHLLGYRRQFIADAAGCSPDTVGTWRRTHGLSRRKIR